MLQKQGYQVVKSPGQRDLLAGGIIELDGTIAGKEDITVDSLGEKQVLGLNGKNAIDLIDAFELLQAGLSEEIGENLDSQAKFYEAILHFAVKTQMNPMEVFASIAKDYPFSAQVSNILGEKVAPFCYKVSPMLTPVNSVNWFEFTVEPLVSRATSSYHVGLVYRNQSKERVINILKDFKSITTKTISLLEKQEYSIPD